MKDKLVSYVSTVDYGGASRLLVKCFDGASAETLKALGGRQRILDRATWIVAYEGDEELALLLSSLRDSGIAMLGHPHGWPPASVFETLREKGLLEGEFEEISFGGQGQALLSNR